MEDSQGPNLSTKHFSMSIKIFQFLFIYFFVEQFTASNINKQRLTLNQETRQIQFSIFMNHLNPNSKKDLKR